MGTDLVGYLSPVQSLVGALSQSPAEGPVITQLTATENGTYQEDDVAYSPVVVDVQPPLEAKSVTPTKQTQVIEPISPNYGLSRVTVDPIPSQYVVPSGTKTLTANGTHDVAGYASAEVAVPGPSGTVQITTNGTHNVSGYATAEVNVPTGGGGNADGIIAGSLVALENATATKIRREFASVTKRYNYRNLPSGYTQVEYIRASGTQYIDTGVVANSPRTAQLDIEFMSRGVTQIPCGAQKNSANAMQFLNIYYYALTFAYGSSSGQLGLLTANKLYKVVTTLRNGYQTLAIDGANQGQTTKSGDLVNDIPFFLFANNNNGNPTGLCDAKIYGCVIHNGNSVSSPKLCDLVPCIEDATGKYGMYDLVSNTFKGNSGTGDFTGGPTIPNLVYGYTSADFAAVTEIGDYAFYNNDLQSLTLRANQVVALGEHALDGTPIASGTGRVYVPSALVSAYKADAAWAAYSGRIAAIS